MAVAGVSVEVCNAGAAGRKFVLEKENRVRWVQFGHATALAAPRCIAAAHGGCHEAHTHTCEVLRRPQRLGIAEAAACLARAHKRGPLAGRRWNEWGLSCHCPSPWPRGFPRTGASAHQPAQVAWKAGQQSI